MQRLSIPILVALASISLVLVGCQAPADAPAESEPAAEAPEPAPTADTEAPPAEGDDAEPEGDDAAAEPPARPRFVAPVRGEAEIGYLKPDVKVQGNNVVTTIKVKNLSNGAIAGMRIEEFWWDSNSNPLPADSQRLREPLMPQGVAEIVLTTPKSADMARNSYKFSHANGTIKTQLLTVIEE